MAQAKDYKDRYKYQYLAHRSPKGLLLRTKVAKLGGRGLRRSRARWLRSLLWVADNSRCFFTFRTGWMNLITFYIEVLRYKFFFIIVY